MALLLGELGFPATGAQIVPRLTAMLDADEVILVAECRGTLLGVLSVHVTPVLHRPTPVGRLTALVVAESARGQGVGRALVATAETVLADRGCALVEVTSNFRLHGAHEFYKRLGYEMTSARFKKSL